MTATAAAADEGGRCREPPVRSDKSRGRRRHCRHRRTEGKKGGSGGGAPYQSSVCGGRPCRRQWRARYHRQRWRRGGGGGQVFHPAPPAAGQRALGTVDPPPIRAPQVAACATAAAATDGTVAGAGAMAGRATSRRGRHRCPRGRPRGRPICGRPRQPCVDQTRAVGRPHPRRDL